MYIVDCYTAASSPKKVSRRVQKTTKIDSKYQITEKTRNMMEKHIKIMKKQFKNMNIDQVKNKSHIMKKV